MPTDSVRMMCPRQLIGGSGPTALRSVKAASPYSRMGPEASPMSLVDQCSFVGSKVVTTSGMSISSVIRPTGRPAENTPIRSEAVSTRPASHPAYCRRPG